MEYGALCFPNGNPGNVSTGAQAAVGKGQNAQPDFRNAYETQLVLDAVLESAKGRQWLEVDS